MTCRNPWQRFLYRTLDFLQTNVNFGLFYLTLFNEINIMHEKARDCCCYIFPSFYIPTNPRARAGTINNTVRTRSCAARRCVFKKIINRRAFRRNDLRLKARNFMPSYENLFGSFIPPIKKGHDIRREILAQGNEARLLRDAQRAAASFPATRFVALSFSPFWASYANFIPSSLFFFLPFPDCPR